MKKHTRKNVGIAFVLLIAVSALAFAGAACGDDGGAEPTSTSPPAATAEPTSTPPPPTEGADHGAGEIAFEAASAPITVDGDTSDWDGIESVSVPLEQIEIPEGVDWDEPAPLDAIDVNLKVATDANNVYVLLEAPDDYDYNPADHNMSAAMAIMFLIDPEAGPHMGTSDDDLELSLGMVDLWHWELDCAAGEMSGGGDPGLGDDPDCNLDDEYATEPEEREDDGDGDIANPAAENSLAGVWQHTASASGAGADGVWIFEMSRPLQTGDPQDAQLASGGTALMALAYFDPDETLEGWTDTGHLQSAEVGWIEVTLP